MNSLKSFEIDTITSIQIMDCRSNLWGNWHLGFLLWVLRNFFELFPSIVGLLI
jgi:hypothetical protein